GLGTLVTPYGVALHRGVLRSLSDSSISRVVDEYRPPGLHSIADVLFYVTVVGALIAVARARRRMPFPWLLATIVTTSFAFRAGRNIALFGVVAWPLVVLHLVADRTPPDRQPYAVASGRRDARFGAWTAVVAGCV